MIPGPPGAMGFVRLLLDLIRVSPCSSHFLAPSSSAQERRAVLIGYHDGSLMSDLEAADPNNNGDNPSAPPPGLDVVPRSLRWVRSVLVLAPAVSSVVRGFILPNRFQVASMS